HSLIRVARQCVEVEVALLDVLTMIAFGRHQAEVALLENRVALVPEGHRPAEDLIAVTEAGDAVLAPAISLRSGQIVRQKRPGVAVGAVVLTHRSPRAIREVRTPLGPAGALMRITGEALFFYIHEGPTRNVKC